MKVFFENLEDDFIRRAGLTQWDYGQELEVFWPSGYQKCRAALLLEGDTEAEIMPASITGEKITAPIPDELLKKGRNICAYLYLATRGKGRNDQNDFSVGQA